MGTPIFRISLTERCNLRCRYCMPAEGIDLTPEERLLTTDEILRLARLFVRHGVTKIRLTGGEPLLRPGAADLAARIGDNDGLQTLALTPNGLLRSKKLGRLQRTGVYREMGIFSTPGSEGAVRLAVDELIVPELQHLVWEVRRQKAPESD